ncbi:MAG: DUF4249 family protein [Saprospiraceae bacterium]
MRLFFLLSVIVIFLQACLEEIALNAPKKSIDNLTITGKLVHGNPSFIHLRIFKLTDFTHADQPIPIGGARVTLEDDKGKTIVIPMSEPGIYEREITDRTNDLIVEAGGSYKVKITTTATDEYESTFEVLQSVPKATLLTYELIEREGLNESGNFANNQYIRFYIDTPLEGDTNNRAFLKWDFLSHFLLVESIPDVPLPPPVHKCYIPQTLGTDKVAVFNGNESNKPTLSHHLILEEDLDQRFVYGFYLTVIQQSVTEKTFRYWDQISKIIELNGNFFDAQPGKVKGNIHNVQDPEEEVFGYFYATQQDTIRLFVKNIEDIKSRYCPLVVPLDKVPTTDPVCFDCLLIPNSSLEKPAFWVE